jgi:hypothetical protein
MRDEEKHEWDRLSGESSKAYAHFCLYRDMGQERSLRKLAADAKTTSKLRQLQHWSSRWKWVERCQRYDDYLELQERLRQEKERRDMRKRHAQIALLGQNIAVKGFEALLAKVQASDREVCPADLTRLVATSVAIERLARGESTDSHEVTGPGGGPIKLGIAETLKRVDEIYGLKKPEAEGEQPDDPGEGTGTTKS